ncbi:doublecortin domain-containing protein 1-like, partial [Argonauta hians]
VKTSCSLETSNEASKDTYSNVVKQQDTSLESYADDHEDNKDIAVPEKRVNGDDFQKTTNTILNSIDLPALSYILRYPIEVWVSSNRKFVSPEAVESEEENRRKKRKIQAKIATELDTHKHILRLLKGRRFEELHPGKYEPTQDTDNPVVITGHWTDITEKEKRLQDKVNRLKDHLDEVNMKENSCQELKSWNTKTNNRLYKQRNMKRVLVYPVGESSKEHGYYVFGDTIEDILRAAEKKLNLRKTANYLFFENGKQVKSFECIKSGDVLRVSHDENFKSDKSEQNNVHLKAEWARAFRRHGPRITDMTVTTQNDPVGFSALPIEIFRARQSVSPVAVNDDNA